MTHVQISNDVQEAYVLPGEVGVGQYFFAKFGSTQQRRLYVKAYRIVVDVVTPRLTYVDTSKFFDYKPINKIQITTK